MYFNTLLVHRPVSTALTVLALLMSGCASTGNAPEESQRILFSHSDPVPAQIPTAPWAEREEYPQWINPSTSTSAQAPQAAEASKAQAGVTVYFDTDVFQLNAQGRQDLHALVKTVSMPERVRLSITGHTDSAYTHVYNQALAHRRAEAVREELARLGWPPAQLQVSARGPDLPQASNETSSGRALNRRATVDVLPLLKYAKKLNSAKHVVQTQWMPIHQQRFDHANQYHHNPGSQKRVGDQISTEQVALVHFLPSECHP
jgi:outer membrane protein OmpA-like peptidoglycan-associated protein